MWCALLASPVLGVLAGTPDRRPPLVWEKCTKIGCSARNGSVVLDADWREVVDPTNGRSCLNGEQWVGSVCSGPEDCAKRCGLNGADYSRMGVTTNGDSLRLNLVHRDGPLGSRVYLLDEDTGKYVHFLPLNQELSFEVDVSTLPCATDGALYFFEMDVDGGMIRFPMNKAGAKYGTGYCDAHCPREGNFIGNYANVARQWGSCCIELDVFEANSHAARLTSHPCDCKGPAVVCENDCRHCDTSGCTWNHYRADRQYYGPGMKVDTTKKFRVVTQFVAVAGALTEVRRLYVQGGKVIPNTVIENDDWATGTKVPKRYDSLSKQWCHDLSWDTEYEQHGGNDAVTGAFKRGMVLAMSLWTDGSMWWLDSGADRGPCGQGPGKEALIAQNKGAFVEFSKLRFGDLDSTY